MSRAFVKEDAPEAPALPDLPVSPHPNWVTATGLAQLRERLAERQAALAALRSREDRLDRLSEAAARRDIRYLEARLASAIPVEVPDAPEEVAFGTTVALDDGDGLRRTYRIVGEDEVDPSRGWITPQAPLARALIGARVGDEVEWRGESWEVVGIGA